MIHTIVITNQSLNLQELLNYPSGARGDHCKLTLHMKWSPGGKTGIWKVTDTYWINLLAYQKEGTFKVRRVGNQPFYSMLNKTDAGKVDEAFFLIDLPNSESEQSKFTGIGGLSNPRNPFCINYNLYWRRDGFGY